MKSTKQMWKEFYRDQRGIWRERGREDWLARRLQLAGVIAKYQQDGKVAIVESGMDCDGVQYWGRAAVVPAQVMAVMRWEEHTEKWADGPFSWNLASPEDEIEYGSRDRGMEAFEDGHPHVIHY